MRALGPDKKLLDTRMRAFGPDKKLQFLERGFPRANISRSGSIAMTGRQLRKENEYQSVSWRPKAVRPHAH